MLTGHTTSSQISTNLIDKIAELEQQYKQQVATRDQLVATATLQTKCQLAELYLQQADTYFERANDLDRQNKYHLAETFSQQDKQANVIAMQTDYRQAVLYCYKAYELTGHHKVQKLLFTVNTNSNQGTQSSEECIVFPEELEQQFSVALQYQSGIGLIRNDIKAYTILKTLSDQGYVPAQYHLGYMYEQGRAGLAKGPESDDKALNYFELAAEQGYALAQTYLGLQNEPAKQAELTQGPEAFNKAAHYFHLAAEQGFAPAQYNLGYMYEQKLIADLAQEPEASLTEAIRYFRLAAEQGYASAQCKLGYMYKQERAGLAKGPESDDKALNYFELAAEQGDVHAQRSLGYMYNHGRTGLSQQEPEALFTKGMRYYCLAGDLFEVVHTARSIYGYRKRGLIAQYVLFSFLHVKPDKQNEAMSWFEKNPKEHLITYCNELVTLIIQYNSDCNNELGSEINRRVKFINENIPVNESIYYLILSAFKIKLLLDQKLEYALVRVAAYIALHNGDNQTVHKEFEWLKASQLFTGEDAYHLAQHCFAMEPHIGHEAMQLSAVKGYDLAQEWLKAKGEAQKNLMQHRLFYSECKMVTTENTATLKKVL